MRSNIVDRLSTKQKSIVVFTYDLLITITSFYISYALRLNTLNFEAGLLSVISSKILFVAPIQLLCFYLVGIYRGIWRFSSTPDLIRIIKAVSIAIPASFTILFLFQRLDGVPRSIFFIQWALLIIGIGGGRFAYRIYRDMVLANPQRTDKRKERALILGAGYAGQMLIRDIKNNPLSHVSIVGLLDDDIEKRRKILLGYKVLGGISDLSQIVKKYNIDEIIIAIPSATKEQLNRIINGCNDCNVRVKTIPRLSDIISGKLQISKLRKVTPSDLLGRDQVDLDVKSMSHMLTDKIVLVTGAGGSIGSELCKQIAKFKPEKLVCYDFSEFNLYELKFKLEKFINYSQIEYVIGDIRDEYKLDEVFDSFRPNILFHAAAYKHVPMMELNPFEAIKVNVFGTRLVANMATKYKLDRFVLVSTDKAVNPTNVMGTTKRIAEMICQNIQESSKTKYSIVRFGNVLGSSGSVIPRFQKQIENGGPVTVTHPDIIRYFMSIPEAAQLVIQAGALGVGGDIFVLDMGDPIKIVDLAKQMITLAGLSVDEDINIEFTGLRPGEKLYEELLTDSEETLPTANARVRVAKSRNVSSNLDENILNLLSDNDSTCIRSKLKQIVPEYNIPENLIDKNVPYKRKELS